VNSSTRLVIPFKGLSLGQHSFEFEIDDRFFSQLESAVVQKGKASIKVELNKLNNLMECDVTINGEAAVECDRCLDEFYIPITFEGKVIVSLRGQAGEDTERNEDDVDVMFLHPSDDELDLSQYCYESIGLSLPLQKIHPNDANGNSICNREMLDKLKDLMVE
jgi:uncharacterized metal-binding protein YceD (DUF177 family)